MTQQIRRLFAFLATLSLCTCSVENTSSPLRIGTSVWPGYEPLYLARDLGYLPEDTRLVEYSSASQTINAFRNGVIEAAALTLDEVLLLLQNKLQPRIILVMDISAGGDAILGTPDVKTLADIKGKRVGVENTAVGSYVLTRALELADIEYDDIDLIPLESNEHERAFSEDKLDAVVTMEPVVSKLIAAGANRLFDSRQIPNEVFDVLVVSSQKLQEDPQQIRQLAHAWFRAIAFFRDKPADAAKRMEARLKLPLNSVLKTFETLELPTRAQNEHLLSGTASLKSTTIELADFMLERGLLTSKIDTDPLFESSAAALLSAQP